MPKFKMIKRSPDGKIYEVIEHSACSLANHITACYGITDEEIIAIINITEPERS